MKKFILLLLVVLSVGVAARFIYRFVVDEMAWRTEKAVRISVLRHAEWHVKEAAIFRGYPTDSDRTAVIIVAEMNQSAQDEVIDAKNALLWLYKDRDRLLSAEEAAQAAQWQKDVVAWKAENVRP